LINTVKSPTRITHNSRTLIDVMVIDLNWENQTIVYDLVYSDHLAKIAYIKADKPVLEPQAIKKRQFIGKAAEEFIYLTQKESWDQVMLLEDVNESFNAFMITFMCHFNALFPVKTFYLNNKNKIKWMTKGIMVSRNRLRFLNEMKRHTKLSVEFLHYINKYQLIYKNLVREAEKKEGKMIHTFRPQKIKLREYGR
jgi:hypothetical protein